ncbi:MAG: response regulator [Polyangiales bacterium]
MNARGGTDNRNARILVIDDDEIALQAMTDVLERAGFVVHALASPIGATQVIAAQGIAAAVLDLNMPVMRGDRFISLIRSWDRIRDLPIVLVSGESPSVIRQAVAHMPGVSVVTKAHMTELLVSTLQHALLGRVERDAAATESPARPSTPSQRESVTALRSLPQTVRMVQTAWREFSSGRVGQPQALLSSLTALRAELQTLALPNCEQLVGIALELAGSVGSASRISSEVESAMSEVLGQMAVPEFDKVRSFERSLSLTIYRSRLERARQTLR